MSVTFRKSYPSLTYLEFWDTSKITIWEAANSHELVHSPNGGNG